MFVFFQQQLDAVRHRHVEPDALAGADGGEQCIRHAQLADFLAFGFDEH